MSAPRPRDGIRIEIAPRTILYALLAIAAVWLVSLGWGLRRLERTAGQQVRGDVTDRPAGTSVPGKVQTA